jgi:hypothetical protein
VRNEGGTESLGKNGRNRITYLSRYLPKPSVEDEAIIKTLQSGSFPSRNCAILFRVTVSSV